MTNKLYCRISGFHYGNALEPHANEDITLVFSTVCPALAATNGKIHELSLAQYLACLRNEQEHPLTGKLDLPTMLDRMKKRITVGAELQPLDKTPALPADLQEELDYRIELSKFKAATRRKYTQRTSHSNIGKPTSLTLDAIKTNKAIANKVAAKRRRARAVSIAKAIRLEGLDI